MPTLTVTSGADSWVNSVSTTKNYGNNKGLSLRAGGPIQYAFVHLKNPAPAGSTVQSAKLRVYAKGASTGARTLTAKRVSGSWAASRINYTNQPGVTGAGATAAVSALSDGQMIEFDVTADVQALAAGASNFGFRIETNATTQHQVYASESSQPGPTLVVSYEVKPAAPSSLSPSGGLVGVAQPTLTWATGTDDDIASYQVQADPASNGTTPAYDSGEISSSQAQHPLASTAFAQLGTDLNTTFWRVRVRTAGGILSDWSDWSSMQRDNKGTLTLTSPSAATPTVFEPTPPIVWTFTGETQAMYSVIITPASDRATILYESGHVTSATTQYTLPVARDRSGLLLSGQSYSVRVRVWDTKKTRQGSSAAGDAPFQEVWQDFTVAEDGTVTAPTIISAAQDGEKPAVLIQWSRATAPDSFVVTRDDGSGAGYVEIEADIQPADALVSGTTYQYRDRFALGNGTTYSYKVRAVVNGKQSVKSGAASASTKMEGLWILDPVNMNYFVCASTATDDWGQSDIVDEYWPLGSRVPIVITQVLGGLRGTYSGLMVERSFKTVPQMEAMLWQIKEKAPSREMRLIAGRINIPVQLWDLDCVQAVDEDSPTYPRSRVSFSFAQTGDFDFKGKV